MFLSISRGLGPAGALVAGRKVSNWVFMAHPQIRGGLGEGAGGRGVYLFAKLSQIVEITNYYHD